MTVEQLAADLASEQGTPLESLSQEDKDYFVGEAVGELTKLESEPKLDFTLPGVPCSVNRSYRISGRKLILSDQAASYKETTGWHVVNQLKGICPFEPSDQLKVEAEVYIPTGRKLLDADNCLKSLIDGIYQVLGRWGINDQQNTFVSLRRKRLKDGRKMPEGFSHVKISIDHEADPPQEVEPKPRRKVKQLDLTAPIIAKAKRARAGAKKIEAWAS